MSPSARRLQWLAAAGSAVVMAAGIVFFDWPTFTVLAYYWLENVIVGGFTALRILAAGARTQRYAESLATTVFFGVHYGLFCAVHGIFVATLFGGIHAAGGTADALLLMIGRIAGDRIGVLVVAAMLVAAALDAWQAMASLDAGDERAVGEHVPDHGREAAVLEAAHAVGHRALPGKHDAFRRADHVRVAGHDHLAFRRDVRERLRDRAQVAHPVVDDRNGAHGNVRGGVRRPRAAVKGCPWSRVSRPKHAGRSPPPCAAPARRP